MVNDDFNPLSFLVIDAKTTCVTGLRNFPLRFITSSEIRVLEAIVRRVQPRRLANCQNWYRPLKLIAAGVAAQWLIS